MPTDVATFLVDVGIFGLLVIWMTIDIFDLRPKKGENHE